MKKVIALLIMLSNLYLTAHADTDRYRLVFNADPSSTVSISFCASSLAPDWSKIRLFWGPIDKGTNYTAYPNSRVPDRTTNYKDMRNGFFRLSGLQPKTRYFFVIVDSNNLVGAPHVSQRLFFETITNNPADRLNIIYGGDSRVYQAPFDPAVLNAVCGSESARKRADRLVAKLRPDAVWFNGDFTFSDNGAEWACWLYDWQLTISADGRITPIVPAQGNHEVSLTVSGGSGAFADGNSINELLDAANPTNDNYYYALNFGGSLLRLYTLNTLISILGDQTDWLAADLQANNCSYRWKLAQYHFPIRPHNSGKAEQDGQRAAWCPLFEQYHMQLAMESDAHLFKYTRPIVASTAAGSDEGFIENAERGTVYIGEGGWGAELRAADDTKDWTLGSGSFFQFQWLFIDSGKLEIRTVLTDNENSVVAKTDADDRFAMPTGIGLLNVPAIGTVYTLRNPHRKPVVELGDDFAFCSGCNRVLDAGPGFATYQWNTGATSRTITVTQPGTYTVTVKDAWNCTATDGVTATEIILPVRLLHFAGTAENGQNKISWSVAAEQDMRNYVVEKSGNPANGFVAFDSVRPVATTSPFSYFVLDKNTAAGPVTYYRLRMNDKDGKYGYSKTVSIYNPGQKEPLFLLQSNTVVNELGVKVGHVGGKQALLMLVNGGGQILLQENIALGEEAIVSRLIDVSGLPPGLYYAILQSEDKKKRYQKFIKPASR